MHPNVWPAIGARFSNGASEAQLTTEYDVRVRTVCPALPTSEADRLRLLADAIVIKAMGARYRPDPLLPRHLSRAQSAVASVVKRHGHLLARTFVTGVNATKAPDLVATEIATLVTRAGNRQVDSLVFDRKSGRFSVLEIKRGGGKQPSGSRRDQEDRLATISSAIKPAARAWLRALGVAPPRRPKFGGAVLAYYGEYGSTTLPVIGRPDVATRFGAETAALIDLLTEYLRVRLLLSCFPLYARALHDADEAFSSWLAP